MTAPGDDLLDLCHQYLVTQLAGDRRAALRFIDDAMRAGHSVATLRTHVVQAAQCELGRLWQENRISVAQEHLATAVSHLVLAYLFQRSEFQLRVGRKVIVACVPGELHDLPARLVADALEIQGYDVHFLGADVPPEDLLDNVAIEKPDLLALSVSVGFNLAAMRLTLKRLRNANPRLPIAVGGHAVTGDDGQVGDDCTIFTTSEDLLARIGPWLNSSRPPRSDT